MRRAAPILALLLLVVPVPASTHAADPIEIAWTAPPLEATTRAVPYLVDVLGDAVFIAGGVDGTLAGQTSLGNGDGFVARYSAGGELQWARHIGTSGSDSLTSLVVTGSGVFVAGRTSRRFESGVELPPEGFVAHMSLVGQVGWIFAEPDPDFFPVRLAPASDGGVIAAMTGWEPSPGPGVVRPLYVRHFAANGTISWEDAFDGWWTDDVETDATGITMSGQREGASSGEAFVRRYSSAGSVLWTKVVESAFDNDVRVDELASTNRAILAKGVGYVPTDGLEIPERWFVRRFAGDGETVWTKAIAAHRIVADCTSFISIGGTTSSDPNIRPGAYLSRLDEDGVEAWRWTQDGTVDTRVNFVDVAVAGDVAYLIREEVTGGDPAVVRLQAIASIPTQGGCEAPADTTPPTATAPSQRLLAGVSISSGRVPVRLSWSGSDAGSGIDRYELAQSTNGGPWTSLSTTLTAPTLDRPLAPGHGYRFRLRAVDGAGNTGAWLYGPTFRLSHYGELASSVRYSGTWTTSTNPMYWGSRARRSDQAGARATLTATGRSYAWVARTGPDRGKAQVYVNGVLKATVDLYSASYQNQRVVWSGTWAASASRTVSIRVLGTSGRPRVEVDAFLVGS